ncbi:hypothetical protein VPLG_00194 [Vibrio phage eugene 12A10]|nr:hypothetical protein VPLG_00194 [Vibrio phage eugene 12A10]AGN51633.1 hypothetical protein VPLG_00194 [Vibrio phage eugene 12A10]
MSQLNYDFIFGNIFFTNGCSCRVIQSRIDGIPVRFYILKTYIRCVTKVR